MSHVFRFLAQMTPANASHWSITGDELQHLRKVLRLSVGAAVEVTDGVGHWARGTLLSADNQSAVVEVDQETGGNQSEPAPTTRIHLAFGALKPSLVDDILPALTELGVSVIHVFGQQETAKSRLADKVIERWQRILLQAIKQCKRAWMPQLEVHRDIKSLLAATTTLKGPRFILSPGATQSLLAAVSQDVPAGRQDVLIVLGGEIGLNAGEVTALAAAGCLPVSLGPFVLRAVTAAVAAASIAAARYECSVMPSSL